MGKAKNKAASVEEIYTFAVDVRAVLAMKPEQRVRWLKQACRKVADGEANVKHVYDVLSSRKLTSDMVDKVGRRMFRVLKENLYLFSEKQQRFLGEESTLAQQFSVDERSEDEGEARDHVSAKPSDEAAVRMEEMMARCRDFVRQKASTFEERIREAQEAEDRAREELEREAREKLAKEWDAIHKWHKPLEVMERAQMTAADERTHVREAEAVTAAAAAAASGADSEKDGSEKPAPKEERGGRTRGRSRHSSESSRGGSSGSSRRGRREKKRRRERDRDRDKDRGDRDKDRGDRDKDRGDRDKDRGRRRRSSSSSAPRQAKDTRRRFFEASR